VAARIAEPARTIEVASFLRYCLLVSTDRLLLMLRRRVADLWRTAAAGIDHSLAFRSRETLFIPEQQWQRSRRAHYRRLSLPTDPKDFLQPLI
jgi:hypothetical protein